MARDPKTYRANRAKGTAKPKVNVKVRRTVDRKTLRGLVRTKMRADARRWDGVVQP